MVPIRGSLRPPAFGAPFSNNSGESTLHTEYFFCGHTSTAAARHQHSSSAAPAQQQLLGSGRTRTWPCKRSCQRGLTFKAKLTCGTPCCACEAGRLHVPLPCTTTHNLLWVPDTELHCLHALHWCPTGRKAVHGGCHGCCRRTTLGWLPKNLWKPPAAAAAGCLGAKPPQKPILGTRTGSNAAEKPRGRPTRTAVAGRRRAG
jgi:hypothetical protein